MFRPVYIFLDFDGVTHPWGEVEDFRSLPLIEDVGSTLRGSRIVIASDWRTLFSMPRLSARFAPDIRPRVVARRVALTWCPSAAWICTVCASAKHVTGSRSALKRTPNGWPSTMHRQLANGARGLCSRTSRGFTEEDAAAYKPPARCVPLGRLGRASDAAPAPLWA